MLELGNAQINKLHAQGLGMGSREGKSGDPAHMEKEDHGTLLLPTLLHVECPSSHHISTRVERPWKGLFYLITLTYFQSTKYHTQRHSSQHEACRSILDNSSTAQVLSAILSPEEVGQGRKENGEIQMDFFSLDMFWQGQTGIDSSSQSHCHVLTSPKFLKFHKFP